MTDPKLLRVRWINRPGEDLRVYLYDGDEELAASFDDLVEARRWLKEHGYIHSPVNGGLWVKRR